MSKTLTIAQAAERLGLSIRTVYNYIGGKDIRLMGDEKNGTVTLASVEKYERRLAALDAARIPNLDKIILTLAADDTEHTLTTRQRDILVARAEGDTYQVIADTVGLSRQRVAQIINKLIERQP